jgi:hypothetical protein
VKTLGHWGGLRGSPRVDDLALPKSVESDNLSLDKAVIRRMPVEASSRKLLACATVAEGSVA